MLFLGGLKDIMPGVDEFINKLIPSWQAFVIQVLATLILFFFIVKFLFKPVREILKKRQDFIESNINQSKISLSEAQKTKEECEKQLSSISSQAQDIILEAKNEGEKIKEKKIAEADEEIANKKEELRKEIEQEKIRANDEIRKTIIDVAIGASSKILEREVSSKDNEYLIDEFIKEVGSNEQ